MKKRIISFVLALIMVVSLLLMTFITSSAAKAPAPEGGMTFKNDALVTMDKNITVSDNMTIEAEFWMSHDQSTYKPTSQVTLLSNFGDNGINAGKAAYRVDITQSGNIQFWTRSYGQYLFNSELICSYMYDEDGNSTFVKIAIVIDVADYTDENGSYYGKLTLYINGEAKQSIGATKSGIKPGVFTTLAPLCIGGDYRIGSSASEVNTRAFTGRMKNLTIYSDMRTPEEIAASASASTYSVDKNDTNLIAGYDLTKPNYLLNLSGSGNDLGIYPTSGMSFTKDTLYAMQKNLVMNGSITIESAIWIPEFNYTSSKTTDDTNYGAVIGNYGDH